MTEGLTGYSPSTGNAEAGSRQQLKQRPWRNTTHLPALHEPLSLLSQAHQGFLPEDSITHRGLSPPSTIIGQENDPTDSPAGHFYGGIFSIMVRSSQITLACVELISKAGRACVL